MDALQIIVDILDSMGPGLVTAIVIMVALILIWLIIRASRRGSDRTTTAEQQAQRSRYDVQPAEPQVKHERVPVSASHVQPEKSSLADATQSEAQVAPIQSKVETSVVQVAEVSPEPEDSVLHRHFEAEQAAKKAALVDPYPTDSVLRRHYDNLHKIHLDTEQEKPTVVIESASVTPKPEQSGASRASIIEQAIRKDNQTIVAPVSVSQAKPEAKAQVPQDSVLRRHFMSQLRAEIALSLSPRPTDSVLQRHYDALVECELEKRLQC